MYVAGVDAAYGDGFLVGVASLFRLPELSPVEDALLKDSIKFPYVPGFLGFREGPVILKALKSLKLKPDLVIFDGQGIAHPRGLGIASHVGVLLRIPTIGCAKTRLVGSYIEPGPLKGSFSYLYLKGKKVGAVLRTKDNTRPLFVSPGHLIDITSAISIVLSLVTKYRIPEPLRRADLLSKKAIKADFS